MILAGIRVQRDLAGETFGDLTVLALAGRGNIGKPVWRCRCSCGSEVVVLTASLTGGNTKSCGCRRVAVGRAIGHRGRVDQPSYKTAHRRVVRERGRACYQACADCNGPAVDWSYDHTDPDELEGEIPPVGNKLPVVARYSAKPQHYSPRCKRCHLQFDRGRP